MKSPIWMGLLILFALMASGCAHDSLAAPPAATTVPRDVEDKATLIAALERSGATIEIEEPVSQVFFTPEGSIIKVNGADVQVFEYETVEAMEEEASQVAPDGSSIGTSMVTWIDAPSFYKAGRIIALYVGNDATVLDLLEEALGTHFAGR
jgi:hypothetical protein